MGIMAPMVGSAEEAEYIVSCTRYPPKGRRGAAFGFTADDYVGGSVTDIIKVADERTLVMCLIETAEGIENVDKIAAVPGVDVLWLGHFDLTNFLGIPAQFDHPKYRGRDQEDDRRGQEARQGARLHDGRRQVEPGVLGPGVPAVQRRGRQLPPAERDPQRDEDFA